MTTYTREELRGIRKYKRELRARRQRLMENSLRFCIKATKVIFILWLICRVFAFLEIDGLEEMSSIDKYPTPQDWVDHLNSSPYATEYLTVEDLYGDLSSEGR